jgi:tRNA uridine 5-carbamoylmethylation protein Kti12
MELIILYGPVASGKLTVANELAAIADVKIFDNHQAQDIIEPIVTRQYTDFATVVYGIWRSILDAAVKANQVNVVFTFPFAANLQRDTDFLSKLINDSRELGADVYPVFLTCDKETLKSRVTEESRRAYGKVTTPEVMKTLIDKYDFETPLQIGGNKTFNTKEMSAKEVATEVKKLASL